MTRLFSPSPLWLKAHGLGIFFFLNGMPPLADECISFTGSPVRPLTRNTVEFDIPCFDLSHALLSCKHIDIELR
ncbi:hypothetical protein GYMLUDRAFT_47307 [Collybiopsis luxurians FD-317 M1]|uniref:Uncharacterized protein n=1 Tax=Collybiopsis luxurians FD-317 M1 TaxID=944289 RepID=A0A0D0CLQ3_9AGAR|nr:hypothetical protein GYMLUDRAFT_47307 [Collybiopsis luxurians FD-317 M1]